MFIKNYLKMIIIIFTFQFRVALILPSIGETVLNSKQSLVIKTLAMGPPSAPPVIVRAVAVDHTRISISWEPGPYPNGPILSYVLKIKDLNSDYSAMKVYSFLLKNIFYADFSFSTTFLLFSLFSLEKLLIRKVNEKTNLIFLIKTKLGASLVDLS